MLKEPVYSMELQNVPGTKPKPLTKTRNVPAEMFIQEYLTHEKCTTLLTRKRIECRNTFKKPNVCRFRQIRFNKANTKQTRLKNLLKSIISYKLTPGLSYLYLE